jgi:hypothetical protein
MSTDWPETKLELQEREDKMKEFTCCHCYKRYKGGENKADACSWHYDKLQWRDRTNNTTEYRDIDDTATFILDWVDDAKVRTENRPVWACCDQPFEWRLEQGQLCSDISHLSRSFQTSSISQIGVSCIQCRKGWHHPLDDTVADKISRQRARLEKAVMTSKFKWEETKRVVFFNKQRRWRTRTADEIIAVRQLENQMETEKKMYEAAVSELDQLNLGQPAAAVSSPLPLRVSPTEVSNNTPPSINV